VKPLLNVGGLVRYDEGRGGILLNQLKLPEHEVNPANAGKKRAIVKTLLANMGAVFAGDKAIGPATRLRYTPVAMPLERCTAYVRHDMQPAWWAGPVDLTGMPRGEQDFGGVRFKLPDFATSPVPTAYMLRGRGASVKAEHIDGIAVGAKADALCFLQTSAPSDDLQRWMRDRRHAGDPPTMLTCIVHDGDGQTAEVPMRWGREVGPWLADAATGLPDAGVGWTAPAGDQHAVVWTTQWTNPRPDAAIASVDLVAGEERWGSAAVFAITAATRVEKPDGTF
jgi:beta-galactosidase